MIRIYPRFETQEEAIEAYIAIGMVATNWGPVEHAMESVMILVRFHQAECASNQFPVSFKKKSAEIKRRMNDTRIAESIERRIRSLISDAALLHKIRTDVVHSRLQGKRLDGRIEFSKSDLNKGYSSAPTYYTAQELVAASEKMQTTAQGLIDCFNELRDMLLGVQIPNPRRK
ncbi:MAG: hypothetical protein KDJ51_09805 [Nitratireductor sp.]|nr:hypothetical protein [Nitratireductor sp.]